ncbi:MAG TPA: family 1 glycosylhydrolase [Candidatus Angelobacter sp.]|nr:family 1 glycosylhydrolase [Candidatus Angelobacter sp.]
MDKGPRDPNLVDTSPAFPAGFAWGVATSSHQVEGGNTNNQWTTWEKSGRIKSKDCVGRACDWWRGAERDFDLAQSLGVNALRLSVEWSRIEPEEGQWDDTALARYRQMLRALHERGMRPLITLHHFTNPQWFEAKGAFAAAESVALFQRFTQHVVAGLGEFCHDWATFNEPNVYTALGYFLGEFPPGKKGRFLEAAQVTRNLCLAHAAAYRTIHSLQADANVGWAQHYVVFKPRRSESQVDRWICGFIDRHFNDNFSEGIRTGRAPFPLNLLGYNLAEVKGTCDFVGINYYSRLRVGFQFRSPRTLFFQISVPPHKPQGDSGIEVPYGEVYPEGLRRAVEHFADFKKPVYILENGVPDRKDRIRPWVIESSVAQMRELLAEGVDLRGYFHWTLADNFEWNEGWHLRFGLYELDPVAQTRTARPSAHLYARVIRENTAPHATEEQFNSEEARQNGTQLHITANPHSHNGQSVGQNNGNAEPTDGITAKNESGLS